MLQKQKQIEEKFRIKYSETGIWERSNTASLNGIGERYLLNNEIVVNFTTPIFNFPQVIGKLWLFRRIVTFFITARYKYYYLLANLPISVFLITIVYMKFMTRASSVMVLNQRRWQSLGGQHGKGVDGLFE